MKTTGTRVRHLRRLHGPLLGTVALILATAIGCSQSAAVNRDGGATADGATDSAPPHDDGGSTGDSTMPGTDGSHETDSASPMDSASPTDANGGQDVASEPCTVTLSSLAQVNSSLTAGAVVCLTAGTYGAPTLTAAPASNATLQAVSGASVTFTGSTYVFGSHLTLANITVQDVVIGNYDQTPGRPNPTNVTLSNLTGRDFEIDSSSNVTVEGGSWGMSSSCGGPYGGGNNSIRQPTVTPMNILIDHTVIHDVQSYNLVGCHTEGLAIFAGDGVTVSNSKFYGNSVYDIFMQANSGGNPTNITLKDNWLAQAVDNSGANGSPVGTPNGIALGNELLANVLVQGNHMNDVLNMDDTGSGGPFTNVQVINNVGMQSYNNYPCQTAVPGIVWTKNIWQNDNCGATDVDLNGAAMPYVNTHNDSTMNYTLTGTYANWPN